MADYDFDLFVIGGGSGGVRAARMAAQTGARVALAEESRLGGTCVIRGCVPKKLMVFASKGAAQVADAQKFGWDATIGDFDWGRFHPKLTAELDRLEGVYRKLLDGSGVKIYDSRATVDGPHTVKLANNQTVSAKHILIAVGGHPVRPPLENAELGLVSNDVFLLEKLPKSVLIVGGGYIACEFACILRNFGVEVTIYARGAQILKGFDDEARGLLSESMKQCGIDIHMGTSVQEMCPADQAPKGPRPTGSDATMGEPAGERRSLASNDKSITDPRAAGPIWTKATTGVEQVFDHVIFATGRAPSTDGLGLDDVGVKLERNGAIAVDEYSQTNIPSIYAIGDVTDRVALTPVAIREGMAFVDTVFKGTPTPVDHDLIASAVFTQPELGTVGLTEDDAARNGPIEVYSTSFRPMNQAFIDGTSRVLMKLIVCAETRKVLGCHIVAPDAGELIQMVGIAVKMGATKEDFDRTCAVHPTISEELVTMREPVRTT
ncbi:NADPH-glutathione reductase [Loktanella sp. 3ANDIMAR09]|uniref:FAD-dependent oxidoreductase n=1 Tax=Loktanella sp. 3ANDIMAR09 TaxID=1225657 RepID=UPI0006F1CFA9|nr:FAD-dependent oxidoreductase [Loktanella sp. 3ANDIMAR09]KQI67307.1 NADPH-glutathione reductase [Loktanella sp. 3ANDIMAR09]